MNTPEIIMTHDDARMLNRLVDVRARGALDVAIDELAEALDTARVVPTAEFPAGVVRLGAAVDYTELPAGATRRVVLVHPGEADAGAGRISVLSPVGRALLGRETGAVLTIDLPTGERRRVRIERVRREAHAS